MSLRPYALLALAIVIVGIAENAFFGADHGGVRHDISVGFFLLTVVAVVALVGLGAVALTRRIRS
jgi:hypothetical protein